MCTIRAGNDGSRVAVVDRSPQTDARIQTILVVEDEALVRMAIADGLRAAGYRVIEAGNAHEALTLLENAGEVWCVLTDVRMPGSIDGVALAKLVRTKYPKVKILLTSGHLPGVDWIDHDGFFHKPLMIQRLVEHIKSLNEVS
jgi:two-component system, response regulator PdtaR